MGIFTPWGLSNKLFGIYEVLEDYASSNFHQTVAPEIHK